MKKAVKDYIDSHKGSNLALIFEGYGNKTLSSLLPNLKIGIKIDKPVAEFYGAYKDKEKHNDEDLVNVFLLHVYEDKVKYVIFKEYEENIESSLMYYRKGYGCNEWVDVEMSKCETIEEVAKIIKDIAESKLGKFDSEKQKDATKLSLTDKVILAIAVPSILLLLIGVVISTYYDKGIIGVIVLFGVATIWTYVKRSRKFKKYVAKRWMNNH